MEQQFTIISILVVVAVSVAAIVLVDGSGSGDVLAPAVGFESPARPVAPGAREMVKCQFAGSDGTQGCFSEKGSCQGVDLCMVPVVGEAGSKITWKSTCPGLKSSVIDGKDKTILFDCGGSLQEHVTCVFSGSTAPLSCVSDKGDCRGEGSCTMTISGSPGERVYWKGSCGGYGYTTIDGKDKSVELECGPFGHPQQSGMAKE